MKKSILYAATALVATVMISCTQSGYPRKFMLEGGDPINDYVLFESDSLCTLVVPGGWKERFHYTVQDDLIIITMAPYSRGYFEVVDDETLLGREPFFYGEWKLKRFK